MPLNISDIQFDLLTADPGSPTEGQIWYNTTDGKLKIYRAGAIQVLVDTSNQSEISHLNIEDTGTNTHATIDGHILSSANPHQTSLANINAGTLASLNSKVSDATLDDVGDPRDPNAHSATHKGDGSDPIDVATTTVDGLMAASDKEILNYLSSGYLRRPVRNETGSPLAAGKIVAVVGWSVLHDRPLIDLADKDDPTLRPCFGATDAIIPDGTNGDVIILGTLSGIDTSSWALTDQLVLGNNGEPVRPPPDTDPFTGEVQNIGHVARVDAVDGRIQFEPDGLAATTGSQVFALAGTDGTPSKTNPYVTDSDPRVNNPTRYITVGLANADYTSVKSAIDAAIAGGASATSPWEIKVYPGTYTEDPMTIQSGITLTSVGARVDTATVVAANAAQDLFTCTGGYITGIEFQGVTDSTKALFRLATANTLVVFHGVGLYNCSWGIDISNGASCILTDFSVNITAPGQAITDGAVRVSGAGSYLGAVGGFFSAPAALLPFYTTNPIQTAIQADDGAEAYIVGFTARIANKDTTADVMVADDGARFIIIGSEISNCYRATRIGSVGASTTIIVQGSAFFNNTVNGQSDSASGLFLVQAATDDIKFSTVAGTILSGIIQSITLNRTLLAGNLGYRFSTGSQMQLEDWFHDQTSTGVAYPETTLVTDGGGLDVTVSAGHGWVTRHLPDHDSAYVEWATDSVTCTANATNYVGYDFTTESLIATTSLPGSTVVLLATVVTDASDIRFIHRTRNSAHDVQYKLQEYLDITRKILLKSGMAVIAGTTGTRFEVESGSYYRSLDAITYTGTGTDAVFSYFYGTNGATEVASQTDVDILQYDNAGTLTNMTAGYYRSDTVVVTSDGRICTIYGDAEYSTQVAAENAEPGATPTFIQDSGIRLSRLIVQQGGSITTFVDERPIGAVSGAGGTAITNHGDLSGLGADDHTQYLLASGTRPMAGDLNLGSNNITSVGTVDGVDVAAHGGRHAPGAADALGTGVPVAVQVSATEAEGTAATFARSDHLHGIDADVPTGVGSANSEGTSSSVARSDHIHSGLTRLADDFSVFPAKATPVAADQFLIEDNADAFNKKKLTFGGLEGAVDHLNILNIGTNSHAQLDVHVASILNPHAVTKTQVGLANVTDDAQLKRSASDFTSFTEKAVPISADILLIEDSADSNNKKRVQVGNLPSSGGDPTSSIAEATATTTTTSTADVLVDSMTITPAAGNYVVWFSSSCSHDANGGQIFTSIYSGGVKVTASERQMGFFRIADAVMNFSCMAKVTVNGTQAIEGRWRVNTGTGSMLERTVLIMKVA